MKNSNIQWIGEIPDDWEVVKLIYSLRSPICDGPHETPNLTEEGIPFISVDSLNNSKCVDFSVVKKYISEKDYNIYSRKAKIETNDILFSKAATIGKTAIVGNETFMVWSPIAIIKNNPNIIDNTFLYYLLNCNQLITAIKLSGSFNTQANVGMREMECAKIPLPPLATQTSIADYLDAKCSEIDGLIADINKQIETLNELKKSTITEAVTKGLNKNAKLKDSGIQWIGMIPEGWRVTKLKYIVENPLQYGATESGVDFDDKLPRYIRITDIIDNRLKDEGKLSLTELQSKGFILKDNDILFARSGGTVGKTFIYRQKYGKSAFAGYLIRATISKSNNADFVYYYTLSNCYDNWKSMIFTQATIQNIGADKYNNLLISLPPLAEQRDIATYLDTKCTEFDSIISDKQKQISTLEAYKKSLIYEYVTGKNVPPVIDN